MRTIMKTGVVATLAVALSLGGAVGAYATDEAPVTEPALVAVADEAAPTNTIDETAAEPVVNETEAVSADIAAQPETFAEEPAPTVQAEIVEAIPTAEAEADEPILIPWPAIVFWVTEDTVRTYHYVEVDGVRVDPGSAVAIGNYTARFIPAPGNTHVLVLPNDGYTFREGVPGFGGQRYPQDGQVKIIPPVVDPGPNPGPVYGSWSEWSTEQPSCTVPTVTQTKTRSVTTYKLVDNQWVVDQVSSENKTREVTLSEADAKKCSSAQPDPKVEQQLDEEQLDCEGVFTRERTLTTPYVWKDKKGKWVLGETVVGEWGRWFKVRDLTSDEKAQLGEECDCEEPQEPTNPEEPTVPTPTPTLPAPPVADVPPSDGGTVVTASVNTERSDRLAYTGGTAEAAWLLWGSLGMLIVGGGLVVARRKASQH